MVDLVTPYVSFDFSQSLNFQFKNWCPHNVLIFRYVERERERERERESEYVKMGASWHLIIDPFLLMLAWGETPNNVSHTVTRKPSC